MRRNTVWVLITLVLGLGLCTTADPVRVALFTDLHAHDTNSPEEEKVMVDWAERLSAFVEMANTEGVDTVIQLGDLINGKFVMGAELGDPERIPGILDAAMAVLSDLTMPIHHVLGNHDVYDLSKAQFLSGTGQEALYYSFDLGGFHFVLLDEQFNRLGIDADHVGWMVQGTVPSDELTWLEADLAASDLPTIVCTHQPLDSSFELLAGGPPVSNYLAVRDVLTADGDVIAVFQGHDHGNVYNLIDDIHYITFAALVDHDEPAPLTWAVITLDAEAGTLIVDGAGLQDDYELAF